MKKTLLTFPPAWNPTSPYLSIPLLLGELVSNNINAVGLDLNIEFYNDILNSNYIDSLFKNIDSYLLKIDKILNNELYTDILDHNILETKKEKLLKFKNNKYKDYLFIKENINSCIKGIKTKDFYNPELLYYYQTIIQKALEFISLFFIPYTLNFNNLTLDKYTEDYETIKTIINDEDLNIFKEYFFKKIQTLDSNINIVGISVAGTGQIIPALTLAKYLKENFNVKIILGGNYFINIKSFLINNIEFFDIYTDYVLINKNPDSLVALIKAINTSSDITKIPDLLYKKNKEIIHNDIKIDKKNDFSSLSFNGFDFNKYLSPEIILPYQLSTGCPWGKCTYCSFHNNEKYIVKDIKKVINEIKDIKNKYNIRKFYFVDDAITPKYFEKLSNLIIQENLEINFYSYARLDSNFKNKLLNKIYNAGLRLFQWGIESGDKNIFSLMNKGVNFDDRSTILKNSSKAKIWNHIYLILGFPFETLQSSENTINYVEENIKYMDSFSIELFHLLKNTFIERNYKQFGISKLIDSNNMSSALQFDSNNTLKQEELKIIQNKFYQQFIKDKIQKKYLSNSFISSTYLFLYLCYYDCDYVKQYKLNTNILVEKIKNKK